MLITSLLTIWMTRSTQPFLFENSGPACFTPNGAKKCGLYVHIPFCRTLCSFCPYCKLVYNENLAQQYKDALLTEIDLVGSQLAQKQTVTSLYFGGGTPALLLDDLGTIIAKLREYFVITEGIGIELHPGDITPAVLDKLQAIGVTMLSVGVQSFTPECLKALGREEEDVGKRLELIQRASFSVFDVDLIFALPYQTEKSLLADIEQAYDYGATQISTYPFIEFSFANNHYKPLPERTKKKLLSAINKHCLELGKERTSVWTFAKKNTVPYSSVTRDQFLGFGLSAATLLDNQFSINTFSLDGYLERIGQNQLPTALTLAMSLRQQASYYLFWNAYTLKIYPERFENIVGKSLSSMYGQELWLAQKLGFLEKKSDFYKLTEKGAYYFHFLEQSYTRSYIDKTWNIARLTAFPERIAL